MRVLLAAFILLFVSAPAQASLIGFYSFDASDATDNSGSGNDGSLFNGVTFGAGFEGNAATFDGSNDYIQLPIDINASNIPNLTMGAWVNTDILPSSIRAVLSHDNGSWDRAIQLGFVSGSPPAPWYAHKGNSSVIGSSATAGAWEFVSVRYDGTTVQLNVGGTEFTAVDDTDLDTGTATLRVGSSPGFGYYFDGQIDNVFLYDTVLSDSQIDSIRLGGASAILSIPEPTAALLLASGLTALAVRRRRLH